MTRVDCHYTPDELADQLVDSARQLAPRVIADFTAGSGSLLTAAERRWPSAEYVATDVDPPTVRRLQAISRARWRVGRCDFLKSNSRAACKVLRDLRGRVSLLLLNPPFSSKGASRVTVGVNGTTLRCSPAMAFLLTALRYLAPDGEARAIMPAGALINERDADARLALGAIRQSQILARRDRHAFPTAFSSTVVLRLFGDGEEPAGPPRTTELRQGPRRECPAISARVFRGGFQMHRLSGRLDGPHLVHSTDLQASAVILNGRSGHGSFHTTARPAVLMPRVGRITPGKIAIFSGGIEVMLSDCVFAIETGSQDHAQVLHRRILSSFAQLETLYGGTGAPFITLSRLTGFLRAIGVACD